MTVLLKKISPDSVGDKKFENWSTFDEVIRRTEMCHSLGSPCISVSDFLNVVFGR